MRIITYDLEIKKSIRGKWEVFEPGIEYCSGWRDFENMGISCIGAWDSATDSPRVFLEDNLMQFQELINNADVLLSYNGIAFDNNLLRANGFRINDMLCYDLLREIWLASGLGQEFDPRTHGGFGLGDVAQANLGRGKTGSGAHAPVLYQQGKIGAVVDYCLQDVALTYQLFKMNEHYDTGILCPKTSQRLRPRLIAEALQC